jgi:pimeloyl-ACP methyl ester carboxylesterase
MKRLTFLLSLFVIGCSHAQQQQANSPVPDKATFIETEDTLKTPTGNIYGTLCMPVNANGKIPVALFIAGSGPTDRDCNSPTLGLKTDAFKQLAHKLSEQGIATLRYDKRGIGESKAAMKSEITLRFDNYVDDAIAWVESLKSDPRFSGVYIVGHSEGSLIGMVAAEHNVAGYVSLAGVGETADKAIKRQLSNLPAGLKDTAYAIIDSLAAGKTVLKFPISLYTLFRPTVQPYEISWFKFDPQVLIKRLAIPILIIQGTTDIQVGVDDALRLKQANPSATLDTITGMNHVLKMAPIERQANMATYNNPALPINDKLVKDIEDFIGKKQ